MDRIGILEDDINMGRELKVFLEANGYEGRFIEPGEYEGLDETSLVDMLVQEKLSMLLLDIGLPGFDGIRICKAFRSKASTPVIMITSDSSELTELMSIQSGADDFVPKPFNTRILLARMEGIFRRVYGVAEFSTETVIKLSDGGTFSFDSLKGKIVSSGGEVELSKNEIQIISILISKRGEIVSRDEIMNYLWDNDAFVDDNTLTVNMTRIRQKLEQIGISDAIVTRRGMGYVLN